MGHQVYSVTSISGQRAAVGDSVAVVTMVVFLDPTDNTPSPDVCYFKCCACSRAPPPWLQAFELTVLLDTVDMRVREGAAVLGILGSGWEGVVVWVGLHHHHRRQGHGHHQ